MGNKVSPRAIRLKISQPFDAVWYSEPRQFSYVLEEDLKIRKYIDAELESSGLLRVLISRVRNSIEIKISCLKPAMVVGRRGSGIEELARNITQMTKKETKISVSDIRKPEISAVNISREISNELKKKRSSCRRVMKKFVQNARRSGAIGIRIECSGRLAGAEIARREWYQEGAVPRQTFKADIDYCEMPVQTAWGTCGVKVWVYKGDIIGEDILKNLGYLKKVENA